MEAPEDISLWKEGNSFEVKVKDRTDPLTTRANNAEERAARATQRGRWALSVYVWIIQWTFA
jgi:hypothetical protein